MQNIDGCKNNPEFSFTAKVGEDIPSDFSMSTISPFKSIETKHDVYRGKVLRTLKRTRIEDNWF